jgi:site-specific DNA recombinase
MVDIETHLKELCSRIAPDLDNCTYQDKRDAYTCLDLKVTATPDSIDIKGFLDPSVIDGSSKLPMAEQSSRCLFSGR